jgi:serine/threonine protein kinase
VQYIGNGQFGIVFAGQCTPVDSECIYAAVKVPSKESYKAIKSFTHEMSIMTHIHNGAPYNRQHINVVTLIGVQTKKRLRIVMGYCELGSVESYMRNSITNATSGNGVYENVPLMVMFTIY